MGKSKDVKTATKAKSEVKPLHSVKNASITKPSQTPNAKAKQVAKEVAVKATNGKKSKRAPTPDSDLESASESGSEADDSGASDDSESESEAEVAKPVAKTNGKANGNGVKKTEVDASSSSSSSESESESSSSDDSDSDSSGDEKTAAKESDSEDSESDEETTAPTKAVKKTVGAVKGAVNGAAKAVAKATQEDDDESDDSEDSEDSSDSDEAEKDDAEEDSEDSEDSEVEAEAPSKKRKADVEPEAVAKKSKTEDTADVADAGVKNLFVGNLSWNVDDEWIYREFEEFGEITGARVITDKETGRSRGFGYVEFANSADAAKALKAKKGALIDGRAANVDFSTPRDSAAPPREKADRRAQKFGDSQNPESDTLFLGNIAFEATEDILGEAFGAHGTVVNVRMPTDQETGNPKGFGYITFDSVESAKAAYENMKGYEISGRPLRLDYATPRPERNGDSPRGGGRGRGGFGGRGGGRGGGFGDRGRGGRGGGRGGSTNRGGFGDFKGSKKTF